MLIADKPRILGIERTIMSRHSRRHWFGQASLALSAASIAATSHAFGRAPSAEPNTCTLSIGTYSLKGMPIAEGIKLVSEIGYDGIEIATQPPYDGEPARLSAERRREIKNLLQHSGLRLTALMEHLVPADKADNHQAQLDRLRRVAELGIELSPDHRPLVQTVLGGGAKWDDRKNLYCDRLADWQEIGKQTKTVIAIKPHRGGALSQPSEAIWLINELGNSPWLRMVYDYSHYAFRNLPLDETVKSSLPYTSHIAVKDAVQSGEKVSFDLPGAAGTIDYARLLKHFYQGGYRGDVCVEVSAQVSSKPNYDPVVAAKTSYRNLSAAFESAGVPRG